MSQKEEVSNNHILDCELSKQYFESDKENEKYFKLALQVMSQYINQVKPITLKMERDYSSIDPKYLEKLPFNYKDRIEKMNKGFEINQNFFNKILSIYTPEFDYLFNTIKDKQLTLTPYELNEIKSYLITSLVRDWTNEGKEERELSYDKVAKEIENFYGDKDKKNIKILIPSASCFRIGYELSKIGFDIELNEANFYYILLADYIFNYANKNELEFCPRIHSFCSSYTEESIYKRHTLPDVCVKDELKNKKIKMIKGDFYTNYKDKKEEFDCICTLFFLESAYNVVEYVEIIYNLLKKGGLWINMGSLSYYYSGYSNSIDLTWDELKKVILNYGFEFKKDDFKFLPYGKIDGCSLPYEVGTISFMCLKK